MTGYYEWNPMPHTVAVACPDCSAEARFEFAEMRLIDLKKDVPYFKASKVFEYRLKTLHRGTGKKHVAFYFHGVAPSLDTVGDLPDGYKASDWSHRRYLVRSHGTDVGSVVCSGCGIRRKHELDWPGEAFFQIEHKRQVLWAFDQETLGALIDFVASDDRNHETAKWGGFLRHVPSHFLGRSERDAVLKKLRRLL